jgi:hypothetical protein
MLKSLAIKELRETAGIGVVALIFYAIFVSQAMGLPLVPGASVDPLSSPLVSDSFRTMYFMISGCLAAALGLRQSVLETAFGTEQFLLHRPVSRPWLIGTKLLTGGCVYLAVAAVPVLLYAAWAATPGTHASPFEWSMTLVWWKGWFTVTAIYLGGFLCGIRPGLWKGTRLLPLIVAIFLALLLGVVPWLWAWGAVALVILDAILVTTILYVARTRDF